MVFYLKTSSAVNDTKDARPIRQTRRTLLFSRPDASA